jgi:hypothetical protein
MSRRDDEFYVGYEPTSPSGIGRRTRRVVILVAVVGLAVALALVAAQSRFDFGVFEFGVSKTFEGIVVERPYPMLLMSGEDGPEAHFLVAFGKHGADDLVADLDSKAVRVTGSRVYNERERMIEVHEIEPLGDGAIDERDRLDEFWRDQQLGSMTLVGEIVDSKCHLGVMKPGRGKTHKACAIRCISGGVPPVLRVEDRRGDVRYFLLVSHEGRAVNQQVLSLVAEPVEITGDVSRVGDKLVLSADPSTYRRIDS